MIRRALQLLLAALLFFGLAACHAGTKEETLGVMLTGLDQLPAHLSIQEFWVNGVGGHQAGKGGSKVCCVSLPRHWRPGIKVHVRWGVTNWRDNVYSFQEADVELESDGQIGDMYVHFLPDGRVRAVSASVGPGLWEPNKEYPGPQPLAEIIPRKEPWIQYPTAPGQLARQVENAMKDHPRE